MGGTTGRKEGNSRRFGGATREADSRRHTTHAFVGIRGVTNPLFPGSGSGVGFQLFLGLMTIPIPDPDPAKSGFVTDIEVIMISSPDLDPELSFWQF